jgi:Leucine-rich repeat (LRR) protein
MRIVILLDSKRLTVILNVKVQEELLIATAKNFALPQLLFHKVKAVKSNKMIIKISDKFNG